MKVAQVLKAETAQLHDEIEKITHSNKIFEGTFGVDDYKGLIHINGYIVKTFMDQIFAILPQDIVSNMKFTAEEKKEAVVKDASELNIDIASDNITLKEQSVPFALGALYVMEGSMLGGNVIAKNLKKYAEFDNHGFHYFTFYKDDLGESWKSFLMMMAAKVQSDEDIASAVNGAKQVYECLIAKAKTIF
jgi:heme oxygenase